MVRRSLDTFDALDGRIAISSVLHSVLSILYGYKFIIAILLELYVFIDLFSLSKLTLEIVHYYMYYRHNTSTEYH